MAKKKKRSKPNGGPYLAAAFFCETTIEDKQDGSLSIIRMVDQVTLSLPPSTPAEIPSEQHRLPVYASGLLSFKTGDSPGDHTIRVVMESPSGKRAEQVFEQVVTFTPQPHGGANLRLNHAIMVKKGGLFWFHVYLDGKRVTRMPLQIIVQRAEMPPRQPDEHG